MKKTLSKALALVLAVVLVIPANTISVQAATIWDNVPETNYASRYTSSYYTYGKFYENMTKIPLTGDGARDVVAVAASQMGYLEGDSSAGQDGVTGGSSNMTEYGAYTNVNGAAWCASFCAWCFYTAEVTDVDGYYYKTSSGNIWADTYVPYWSTYMINQGRYKYSYYSQYSLGWGTSQAFYVPQPGDLVFFKDFSKFLQIAFDIFFAVIRQISMNMGEHDFELILCRNIVDFLAHPFFIGTIGQFQKNDSCTFYRQLFDSGKLRYAMFNGDFRAKADIWNCSVRFDRIESRLSFGEKIRHRFFPMRIKMRCSTDTLNAL